MGAFVFRVGVEEEFVEHERPRSVSEFGQGDFAKGGQIGGALDDQADAGAFGVFGGILDGFDDGGRKIVLEGGLDSAITENEGDAEAAFAGCEVDDIALFEAQAQRPTGLG